MKKSFGLIGLAIWPRMHYSAFRFSRRIFLVVGVVFLFMTQSLLASGTIRGKVLDKETKTALPGANVLVKGTSIGAATDLSGSYAIPYAPTGKQTLVVTYIGYVSMNVNVTVAENSVVKQDFELTTEVVEGEEVVVTAQAQGQMQAINQQLPKIRLLILFLKRGFRSCRTSMLPRHLVVCPAYRRSKVRVKRIK